VPAQFQAEDDEQGGYQIARVLALSDGVFAIALTLLAFSLRVAPEARANRLGDIVRNQWPVFFAYALSVVVIGGFWIGHHRAFARISRVDTGLLWINFVFLGLLALVPYPTDLLGRFPSETPSVALYAGVVAAVALTGWCLYEYARRNGLFHTAPGAATGRLVGARALSVCVVFAVSVAVAFWSPLLAQLLWLVAIPARMAATRWAGGGRGARGSR
jgi:uncharacterized membrane protein